MKEPNSHPRILHHHFKNNHVDLVTGLVCEAALEPTLAAKLLFLGAVYINGQRANATTPAIQGAYLRLHLQPRRFALPPWSAEKLILVQEANFLIALKPAGFPTHATLDNQRENLLALLEDYGPLYPVQRLDQMTHGLLLIARHPRFQKQMQHWQQKNMINKIYYAYTANPVPLGTHIHFSKKHAPLPRTMSLHQKPGDLRCELEVLQCQKKPPTHNFAWDHYQVALQLKTGRTHQIRAQMCALDAPLLGDQLYGSREKKYEPSPLLAQSLAFPKGANEYWHFAVPAWFTST